jgi:TolB protein
MHVRRRTLAAAFAAVVVGGIALVPAATHATSSATNGRIAFSRYRYVNSPLREEIWAANPDGSGLRQITRAAANYIDSQPDWAPSGRSLIFTRCAPLKGQVGEGRCTVWSVQANGGGAHMLDRQCTRVGPACPDDSGGRYSPDGSRIAVLRFNGIPGIAVTNSSLGHAHSLFPFGDKRGVPDIGGLAWSPDGTELAFTADNDNGNRFKPVGGQALFVIGVDGKGLRRLTRWNLEAGGELGWSPDGTRILFRTVTAAGDGPGPSIGDLYTIRPDGSGLRRLTHFPAGIGVQLGSYSPDGTKIVFSTTNNATAGPGSFWPDVFTMNADGSGITPLTRTKNWEGTPDWGTG